MFKSEIKKTRPVVYRIEINGKRMPKDIFYLVENLADTDGLFNGISVYDSDLRRWLIDNKIVTPTNRGSVFRGPNFKKFQEEVIRAQNKIWRV